MGRKVRLISREIELYKRIMLVALPIAAQSLITIGVNMMDNIMVGALGETALSAVSLANQFINVYHVCCMGLGMGASVLVSRYFGMKDIPALKRSITIMLRLCIFLGTLFMAATAVMPGKIMRIYTSDTAIVEEGIRYFSLSVYSYLLLGLSLTCTIVLRSVGKSKIPLTASIGAFFLNVFFNYIFIFGKLGAPAMGVKGAALGTLLARIFEFAFIGRYLFFIEKEIGYRPKDLFMKCSSLLREYMRISIPVLISDTLLALGNSAVAMVMGHIGGAFVSANAITTVTQQLTTVAIQGLSQAGCIMVGQTLGEGNIDRAKEEGWAFLGLGIVTGVLGGVLIMILAEPIISFYNIAEETKEITRQLMDAVGFIVIFQTMNSVLTKGVLRGGGDTKFLMIADILFLWVASIPLGYLAGLVWNLSAFWIYTLLKIDQMIKCIWCIWRMKSGKWIKKIEAK